MGVGIFLLSRGKVPRLIDGRRKPASFALRASFDGANCRQSRAKNLFYLSRGEKSFEKAWGTPSASSKARAEAFASRAASFFQLKKRSRPPIFSSNSSLSLSLSPSRRHFQNSLDKPEEEGRERDRSQGDSDLGEDGGGHCRKKGEKRRFVFFDSRSLVPLGGASQRKK
jgi:hypothetical protein